MPVIRNELAIYADRVAKLLDNRNVVTPKDFRKLAGTTFYLENSPEYIYVESQRRSEKGVHADVLFYVVPVSGIPIEVRVIEVRGYSRLIVRHEKQLNGYAMSGIDALSNVVQQKKINSNDLSYVVAELERLKENLEIKRFS